jgi:hypothetical protein
VLWATIIGDDQVGPAVVVVVDPTVVDGLVDAEVVEEDVAGVAEHAATTRASVGRVMSATRRALLPPGGRVVAEGPPVLRRGSRAVDLLGRCEA